MKDETLNTSRRDNAPIDEAAQALRALAGALGTMATVVDRNGRREAEEAKSDAESKEALKDPEALLERLVAKVISEVRRRDQPVLDKLLYDKASAAYVLSVCVRTIDNMLANKQLSYRRCGRKVLIPAADIRRVSKLEQLQNASRIQN